MDLIPQHKIKEHDSRIGTPEIFHTVGISDATIDQIFEEKNVNFMDPAKFNKKHADFLKVIDNNPKYDDVLSYYIDTHLNEAQWFQSPFEMIGQLRWLMEGRGISMQAWNMDSTFFSQGFYRFINHPEVIPEFTFNKNQDLQVVLQELINIDPSLGFISLPKTSQKDFAGRLRELNNPSLCNKLKEQSLTALK